MTPKATGGRSSLRDRVGLLFGSIFLIAALRWVVQERLAGSDWVPLLLDSRFWLVTLISIIFFTGLRWHRLRVIEPFIFLTIATIPFLQAPDSIFGFGLFAVGAIMLFVDGQLSRHSLIKLCLLGLLLVVLVCVSTIVTHSRVEIAIG